MHIFPFYFYEAVKLVSTRPIIYIRCVVNANYATSVDVESAMRPLLLEERATALLEFLKHKHDDRLEEDILQLLMQIEYMRP